jgi:hypothetical protein
MQVILPYINKTENLVSRQFICSTCELACIQYIQYVTIRTQYHVLVLDPYRCPPIKLRQRPRYSNHTGCPYKQPPPTTTTQSWLVRVKILNITTTKKCTRPAASLEEQETSNPSHTPTNYTLLKLLYPPTIIYIQYNAIHTIFPIQSRT